MRKAAILIVIIAILAIAVTEISRKREAPQEITFSFAEYNKIGGAALFILGDYFAGSFALELGHVVMSLPPGCSKKFICTERHQKALVQFLDEQGIVGAQYHLCNASDPIMRMWARDVAIMGQHDGKRVLIVSPNSHASSREEATEFLSVMEELFREDAEIIEMAPFVFDGGNMAFVENDRRILLIGQKMILDNERYQLSPWAPGLKEEKLLEEIERLFGVDEILVVGRADTCPPAELYFEDRLDMSMVILGGNRALVSEFSFGEKEKAELREAIGSNDQIVDALFPDLLAKNVIFDTLDRRLTFVAEEYDHNARLLDSLGLEVQRSPMTWRDVAGRMSWTNVLQTEELVFMPLYPDSLRGVVTLVRKDDGSVKREIELEHVSSEQFGLLGYNYDNREIYRKLGYPVIEVPEYFHYFGSGLHRFVNVLY